MGKKKERWKQLWADNKHEILKEIRKKTKRAPKPDEAGMSICDLADIVELPPREIPGFVEYMKQAGANIYTQNNKVYTKEILGVTCWTYEDIISQDKIEVFGEKVKGYKIGVISDTHFGSNRMNLEVLVQAYNHFERLGIKDVLHAGNVLAGHPPRAYRHADFELATLESQVSALKKNYPKKDGIKTHFILGRTDMTFERHHRNPAMDIVEVRDDFNYLGIGDADIVFNPVGKKPFRLRVFNAKLRFTYTVSYQAEKQVESLAGGDRPAILLMGGTRQHWMKRIQGIDVVKLSGLQHQTMEMRAKKYHCNVGFYVLSIVPTIKKPEVYVSWYDDMSPGPEPKARRR